MTDKHVLHIWKVEGEFEYDYDLFHPETCSVWVGSQPDPFGVQKRYECQVGHEIDAAGFDSIFPEGLYPGWWLLEPWSHTTPSTPNGPPEHDAGVVATWLRDDFDD